MKKKYLDSNVFIYPLLYEDKRAKFFENILLELVEGKFKGFTSVLTWDELVYILLRQKGKDIATSEGEKFLRFPNVSFVGANLSIVSDAQKLIKKYSLKPRDAIHVASALNLKVDEIVSDDSDFDKVKEIKRVGFN